MNTDYKVIKLLNFDETEEYKNIILNSSWVDGLKTTNKMTSDIKNNEELINDSKTDEMRKKIIKKYSRHIDCIHFTDYGNMSNPIISKMSEGCYYKTHIDSPYCGNYSTTLFLSNPNEYDGGELCLYISGTVKKIKLKAGNAIIYKSGTPHCVNTVKSGTRIVSVSWIKSKIQDEFMRETLYKLRVLKKQLVKKYPDFGGDEKWESLENAFDDPLFTYKNIKHSIQSRFSSSEYL